VTVTLQPVVLDAAAVSRCRRRVHLDHDPSAVGSPRARPDPALEQRRADAVEHRVVVGQVLASQACGGEWVEVPSGAPTQERLMATGAAVAAGARYIWGGLLPLDVPGARTGSPDLLVRAAGGYHPVIIVRHRITDAGSGALCTQLDQLDPALAAPDPQRKVRSQTRDQLRLAHLVRMLQAAGWAAGPPEFGAVIGMDADVVLWHDLAAPTWPDGHSTLAEYDRRFADRLAVVRAAASGGPALAQPSRVNECRHCSWWPTCEPQLSARLDVSLVLRGEPAVALRAVGVETVADLAALDPAGEPPVPLGVMPFADAVALARAWQRELSVVRRVPRVAVPRADVELDVDLESFGEAGAYLWGCHLTYADGMALSEPPGYRAFATWCPLPDADEGRSFAEFWGWLRALRAQAAAAGRSFAAYCYNAQAENRWLYSSVERFAGQHGVPSAAEITEFVESGEWVDLFALVSEWFLCAHGKGLKRIAPQAGFEWHDPEAGGENSMRWYRDAVGMNDVPPEQAAAQRARLLVYNSDDVAATLALRRWMCSPAVLQIPLAADL